ncbi:unnamed protein product, partial [marine sediment metagenome]
RYSELSEEKRKERRREHAKRYYRKNREKCLEYGRNYYHKNKEKISKYRKEWWNKCREEWIKLLGGKCMHCGNDNKVVLDFHHIDLSKKEGSPDRRNKKEFRKAIEEKEIILLCANCHRQEHHNIKMKKGRDVNE